MMKRLWLLILLVVPVFSYAVNSNLPFYQVEIIIYKHITSSGLSSEIWTGTHPELHLNEAVNLMPPYSGTVSFVQVPSSGFRLNAEASRLSQDGYQILMHTAWLQQFLGQTSRPIHLYTDQTYSQGDSELDGTLTINKDTYFNVNANLILTEPMNDLSNTQQVISSGDGMAHFTLSETRRMRSNELNYFDHPLMGMLILITPSR